MRIVGGAYRGRKIEVSRGFDSRPTTDFAREALFNILNNRVDFENIIVLDLFCGTGSISFEFASRGCTEIDMVDTNGRSLEFIQKMAREMEMKGLNTVRMNVFKFIPVCRKKYDVIFADPPFEMQQLPDIPDFIMNHQLLMPEGVFILEHGKSQQFKSHPNFTEERNYGSVHFSFFR